MGRRFIRSFGAQAIITAASLLLAAGAAHAQDAALIAKGEYVARAANCVACHSVPDGKAFAGGLKMATPLGNIYTTNITPDPEAGIGGYTLEDFDAAVRLGVAKDGHRLYPAMPYPSYVKMSGEDIKALYEYFMKAVPAAKQANLASEIPSPLNMRWPLAIWNVLFVDMDQYEPKPNQSAEWNRGAYLVQGPGHCGACHTPRGIFWQEKALDEGDSDYISGAMLDHWLAVNLTQDGNSGLGRWSHGDIVRSLKTGQTPFGTAFGTMVDVVNNSTQFLSDADVAAMATYLKSLPGAMEKNATPWAYSSATTDLIRKHDFTAPGAKVFFQQCRACHVDDGKGYGDYLPPLAGNPAALAQDASSLINIVLNGSLRLVVGGTPDGYRMPAFRSLLNDQQVAEVVTFIRNGWGNKAPAVTPAQVAEIRDATDFATDKVVVLKMK
ncbi:MAG: cytochrome c [Rhodospirillaceae bacterium]|nr:cytochrome c [Rhodospirillaceae bacterium]